MNIRVVFQIAYVTERLVLQFFAFVNMAGKPAEFARLK